MSGAALAWWRLAAYGLPGVPLAAATMPVFIFVPTFYAVDLGLGLAAVGAVLFATRIWDMVTDPLIGWLSDRTGGRLGRRAPWIVAGTAPTVAGLWLLLVPPEGAGLVHLAGAGALLSLGWTMVMLPYTAWGAELATGYDERSRVAASRELLVVVGVIAATGLVGAAGGHGDGLRLLAIVVAVALPVTVALALGLVPGTAPPARPGRGGWRLVAANRPFLRLLAAWLINGVANGLPATLFVLYVEYRLGAGSWQGGLLFAYFAAAVVGMPAWVALARRIGKHRTWCVAMAWACAWFALAPLLGPGDTAWFLVVCVATGLALGADLALPPAMQADVVDVDTAGGGAERTGLYFGLWGMATKLALAVAVGVAFPLLDAVGFVAADPPAGTLALALAYAALPIALKAVAIALVWTFPLDRAGHAALRARITAAPPPGA